jgi:hypothetical protein
MKYRTLVFLGLNLTGGEEFILATRFSEMSVLKGSELITVVGLYDSFCSVDILDREALGISNVVRKAILFFPPPLLVCMPAELLQSFLEQLTQLTCRFSEGAAQEESVSVNCMFRRNW